MSKMRGYCTHLLLTHHAEVTLHHDACSTWCTRLKKNIFLPVGDFANNVGAQPRAQQCMAQHLGETPGVCLLDMNDTSQSRVVKFSAAGQRC